MLDVSRDETVDRLVRPQPDEVGRDPDHVHDRGKRPVGQIDKRAVEDGVGLCHELEIARHAVRVEPANLIDDFRLVAGVVEGPTVMKDDAVEGRDRDDAHIILGALSRQGE